ncbi:MAG: hypothetical protein OXO52_18210, partial [Rhodospirillales bacterium]|nr:hypothetical protein [Rhodospirillales bacterium]
MRSKHPLLPITVALAACLWTSDAMAQAGAMPVTPGQESRPAAHAGIATHDTGDRPGAGKRPGSEELFGTAQPAAGVDLDAAAELRQQALAAMETLREEIATLT